MKRAKPLVPGEKFNMLEVVEVLGTVNGRRKYLCLCLCGNKKALSANALKSGGAKSCGCIVGKNSTHGKKGTRIYRIWSGLKNRCTNPNNKDFPKYSQRGICESWIDFKKFYSDMGDPPSPQHQIDRINNNGPYSKENCQWATVKEQARNRATSFTWVINGINYPAAQDAADYFGVKIQTIHKWCSGYKCRGRVVPPRVGCEKVRAYER